MSFDNPSAGTPQDQSGGSSGINFNKAAQWGAMGLSAVGLGSQFWNTNQTAKQNQKNREFAENQANVQYGRQLDMWNRTNEYNSPENQMARFEAAGLNPHLIYGKGTPGNSSMTQPGKAEWKGQAPQLSAVQVPQMLGMYNDFRMKNAQIDIMKQQGLNMEMERTQKAIQNKLLGIKLKYEDKIIGLNSEAKQQQLKMRDREMERIIAQTQQTMEKTRFDKNYLHPFVESNDYNPMSSPSAYKALYDVIRWIKGLSIVQKVF